jgi:hypothetical protein
LISVNLEAIDRRASAAPIDRDGLQSSQRTWVPRAAPDVHPAGAGTNLTRGFVSC